MWRRILVAIIALIATLSIVYAMESSFQAAVAPNSGGDVTGRIGMTPSGITGSTTSIGFKKGDKISMNANDWILIRKDNYTDYGCTTDANCPAKPAKNAWLSFAMRPTESAPFVSASEHSTPWTISSANSFYWYLPYSSSESFRRMSGFNSRINNVNNQKIIAPRNLTYIHWVLANQSSINPGYVKGSFPFEWDVNSRSEFGNSAFSLIASEYLGYTASFFAIQPKDFVYDQTFALPYFQYDNLTRFTTVVIFDKTKVEGSFSGPVELSTPVNLRAGVYLDLENVVFATSNGTANGMGTVTMPNLPGNYSVLVDAMASYKAMKARVRDTSLNVALDSVTYNGANANKVVTGTPFDITYSGGTVGAGNTVSIILLNGNNEFKYYQQLETTKATGTVSGISTTNMPLGKYKVYLVNEVVTGNNDATTSSSMVGGYEIEIVDELAISYSPTSVGYSYKRNVNSGDVVGNYNLYEGSNPLTYTIKDDIAVSGRVNNGYMNFVFNNNSQTTTGNTPISNETVKINSAGPNIHDGSLKPGKYCFILEARDSSGHPTKGTKSSSVCVDVDPSLQAIAFPSTQTRFEKLINSQATMSDEVASPSGDGNGPITYAITGSTPAGIATINPTTGEILATGAGTITVTATRTDPDGNYAPATATKTIKFYDGIAGTFTQKITPLHQGDANAMANSSNIIANVSNVTGGMGTIKFVSFAASQDGNDVSNHFRMSPSGNFTPLINLQYGTYDFTVTLEDDNGVSGQTIVQGQLIVSLEKNTAFKITATNNLITKSLSDAQSSQIQLATTGKKGNGSIHYEVAASSQKDPSETSEAISVSDGGLIQANRAMSPDDVYKVFAYIPEDKGAGLAKQITQEVEIKITKIPQTIVFDVSVPNKVRFEVNKTFTILATTVRTDSTTGTITYKSSTPTICSVDDPSLPTAKMLTKGTCSITAENKDASYVGVTEPKSIELYEGISGTFTQSIKPLNQGDATATAGSTTTIARVGALSGGDGTYTYVSVKAMLGSVDMSSYFKIDASGNITPVKDLKYGEYDMTVTMRDGNGAIGEVEIKGTLSVGLESNAAFKITYDGSVVTTITQDYSSAKAIPIIVSTQKKKGTSAVQFELTSDSVQDPNESGPALEIDIDTGIITVNRAMTTNDVYKIYAYIPEDKGAGLAKQISQEVEVKITNTPQSIVFDASVPTQVKFVSGETFEAGASITRVDGTTGSLRYTSMTPAICTVNDPTTPTVTMVSKGTCIVKAENSDKNYVNASLSKSIPLYDGLSADYLQAISPLRQGDDDALANSGVTIAKIINLAGDQGTVSYTHLVELNGVDVSEKFQISQTGELTPLADIKYGTYDVTITLQDTTGVAGQAVVTGQLVVDLEVNDEFFITYKGSKTNSISEGFTTASKGMSVGTTGKKAGQVKFSLIAVKDPNETLEALSVSEAGVVSVNRVSTPQDSYKVYASIAQDTTQGLEKQITPEVPIVITNAQMGSMQYMVDGTINTMIQKTYEPSGVIQLDIDGKPAGSTVEYELIMDASGMNNGIKVDDVVSLEVDENGKTTGKLNILNASLTSQINQVQIQATVKSSGYADTTLPPISVLIDKAEQTQFKFAQPVYQMPNGSGSFTPVLSGGALHDDGITLNYRLDCTDPYDVSVDLDNPTTFLYDVSDEEGASIVIKARNNGNRNYNMKEVSATLQILKPGISLFDVNVRPGRVITYGNHVTLEPVLVDGESATFTYTSLDTSVLRQDTVTDNVFISENIGTAQIKVIKKESGKTDAEVLVTIKVNPKPVQVEVDQVYSIKVGEEIPTFVMKPFETGVIINNDPLPEPLITTSASDSKTPGTYPITITYPTDPIANRYKFTQVPSELLIEQDSGQASWMIVYPDGTTPPPLTSSDLSTWYASDMVVELVANGDGYDEVSENQMTWNNSYLLSNEGENTSNVYFKKSTTGALSSPITTTVKIDKTEPNITSITGENFNISPLAYLMNVITLDNFFKPGTQIEIKTEDININSSISTSGVEQVHYKVYEIDEDNVVGDIVEENDVAVNTNGIASFKMNHIGQYRVCAVASDYASNKSLEGCADIMVKKIDINVDEDEGLDFNDPDGDGCPDLNIKWIKPNKDWVKLNIDKDKDGIPELNIDSDGDAIADINVDTDKDGKPDLNIVQLKEWNPAFCVTNQQELYCTMKDIKPLINVDIAGISKDSPKDNIPDLNIDTDGDMKANINISKDGKTASVNIAKVHKWEPSKDYKFETFMYDSIGKEEVKVELNNDTDNDGRPDINLDPKGTGKPTLNIDIDGDGIPDVDIDTDGDGKPDINIDKDGNGIADVNTIKLTEWKPEKNVDEIEGFPYDTMEGLKGKDILEDEDSGIQIEKPGGSFLPNYSIKVDDIKDIASDEVKSELDKFIEDKTEVKDIFDVKMSDGTTTVQPDGSVKVRIPLKSELKDSDSVKVIVEQKDGTFKEVSAVVKDGYIEYETDFLGKVGIIADKAMSEPEPDPEPEPELRPDIPIPNLKPNGATGGSTPDTSVKGSYTQGSGGASTGDSTSIEILFGVSVLAMITMYISIHTKKKKKN